MRHLTALLLIGGALLVNEQGVVARVQERPGGYVDVFDQRGGRLGGGRTNRDGDVELFDTRGRRVLILEPGRGVIRWRK